jgi:hypothetical protein
MEKKYFETRDLYLAAFLIFKGVEPVSVEIVKGNKALFQFPSSPDTYKNILLFNDTWMPYVEVLRDVRGRMMDKIKETKEKSQ